MCAHARGILFHVFINFLVASFCMCVCVSPSAASQPRRLLWSAYWIFRSHCFASPIKFPIWPYRLWFWPFFVSALYWLAVCYFIDTFCIVLSASVPALLAGTHTWHVQCSRLHMDLIHVFYKSLERCLLNLFPSTHGQLLLNWLQLVKSVAYLHMKQPERWRKWTKGHVVFAIDRDKETERGGGGWSM